MYVTAYVQRSEDKLWDLVLLTTWVPGMTASAFTPLALFLPV